MLDDILTPEELSEKLKIPLSTIFLYARMFELPGFKIGKHWRFKRSAINEMITEKMKNFKD